MTSPHDPKADGPGKSTAARAGDGRPLRVLVVDDHVLARSTTCRQLREVPNLVVVGEAADGLEGWRSPEPYPPTWCSWTFACQALTASKRPGASWRTLPASASSCSPPTRKRTFTSARPMWARPVMWSKDRASETSPQPSNRSLAAVSLPGTNTRSGRVLPGGSFSCGHSSGARLRRDSEFVAWRRGHVRYSSQIPLEVFAATGGGLAAQVVHG